MSGSARDSADAYPLTATEEWARRVQGALFLASILLPSGFLGHWPFRAMVTIQMLLPGIALLATVFPNDFTLSVPGSDNRRKSLAYGWFFVAFCSLGVSSLCSLVVSQDVHIFRWRSAALLGLLPGVFLAFIMLLAQKHCKVKRRAVGVIPIVACSLIYGNGLVRELNWLLDRSAGIAYPTVVLHKNYWGSGAYALSFSDWGRDGARSASVSPALYHAVRERDRICIVVKQGALGFEWYTAQAYPWDGEIAFP